MMTSGDGTVMDSMRYYLLPREVEGFIDRAACNDDRGF